MSAEEDYIERFSDLMEDAESEGVDGINIMMNYLMAYVEAMTGGEEDQGIIWQLGDKDLVISIEPAEQAARFHRHHLRKLQIPSNETLQK
ncbi:hypothetical protein ACSOR2_004032 [Escherichia coli]|uniref:hypothetical protein n=2 Tax=Escherichia coli TaxID=562 RepID=UPI001C466557|nr:hypothetical protein [Escherichia coli]